jgi:hypothetical protein
MRSDGILAQARKTAQDFRSFILLSNSNMVLPSQKRSLLTTLMVYIILLNWVTFTVLAEDCRKIVDRVDCWICGKAVNHTPWTMLYTTDPGATCRNGDSCCRIYNWNDGHGKEGDVWSGARDALVRCHQKPLGSNQSAGGSTCGGTKVDVDALTFADREFVVWRYIDGGRLPQTKTMTRGVWVKFASSSTIECTTKDSKPYCYIGG